MELMGGLIRALFLGTGYLHRQTFKGLTAGSTYGGGLYLTVNNIQVFMSTNILFFCQQKNLGKIIQTRFQKIKDGKVCRLRNLPACARNVAECYLEGYK
ncbi:hypothetical protein [Dyadobacter luticola]|uniref:hypothetical protein n=1 Tax=Dyadobacter luticola TaxID=1979387 RepID=UPI00197AB2B3|nr:hypothetical protein [Dyadobacter luticola]